MPGNLQNVSNFTRFCQCLRFAAVWASLWIGVCSRSTDAADLIYVSLSNSRVVTYDVSLGTPTAVENSLSIFAYNSGSQGLAFDATGDLFVTDGSVIKRFNSIGGLINPSPFASGLSNALGLAFDSAGILYAANAGYSTSTITRYNSSGTLMEPAFASDGLSTVSALAFDNNGNLYAANQGNGTITRYDSTGSLIGGSAFTSSSMATPRDLAFDTTGKLYVTNYGNSTITRYDSSGALMSPSPYIPLAQGLYNPVGLAFDQAGNLYAANSGGRSISKYNRDGIFQFSWSVGTTADGIRPRYLAFRPSVIPEPSSWILGGLATGITAFITCRKAKRTA